MIIKLHRKFNGDEVTIDTKYIASLSTHWGGTERDHTKVTLAGGIVIYVVETIDFIDSLILSPSCEVSKL